MSSSKRSALRPVIAAVISVALALLGTITMASSANAATTPTARLVQVLGKMDKFWTGNGSDSEFRLDMVIEVPKGATIPNANSIRYDYNGSGAPNRNAGSLITTENLARGDDDQQYRIIRRDNFGDVDRLTLSMQGDLAGAFDTGTCPPPPVPIYVQITPSSGGVINFQYTVNLTSVSTSTSCYNASRPTEQNARPSVTIAYNNIFNVPSPGNSQGNWGYVVKNENPVVPKDRMLVNIISPRMNVSSATDCTTANSFYYQWVRSDGTPTTITPEPVLKSIKPMQSWSSNGGWGSSIQNGTTVDVGPTDFSGEGPGYYRLVVWPIADARDGTANCTTRAFYDESVGNLSHANAQTAGSVFYTGGNVAAEVKKTFDANPMPLDGTSQAVFTFDSKGTRISGVGFTDTLPANLEFTGEMTEDTCGWADQSITQAQYDKLTAAAKAEVSVGSVLQVTDKTFKVQGATDFDIQNGDSSIVGAVVPYDPTGTQVCKISLTVKHTSDVTAPVACPNAGTTNNSSNVSYQSLTAVLGYNAASSTDFGECLEIRAIADLTVDEVTAEMAPGETKAITIPVTNNGISPVTNVPVTLTAPGNTTFASVPENCTLNGAKTTATCTIDAMANGDVVDLDVSLKLASGQPSGATLTGQSQVTWADDPDQSNNTAPITITSTEPKVDMTVTDVTTPTIVPGLTGTQTVTVKNNGPSDATNATFTYTPPAGVTVQSVADSRCSVADNTVTCSGLAVAADATTSIPITIKVASSVDPASSPITQAGGAVATATNDIDTTNDAHDVAVNIADAQSKLVATTNSVSVIPGATTVLTGQVTNNGPSDAYNPASGNYVTFTLPNNVLVDGDLTYDTDAMTCAAAADKKSVTCDLVKPQANGSTLSVGIPAKTDPNAASGSQVTTKIDIASSSATSDSTLSATGTITYLAPQADLVAQVNRPEAIPGDTATYTIGVTNDGPSTAASPQVVFELPSGVSNPQVPAGCSVSGTTVTCTTTDLQPGDSKTFDITVTTNSAGDPVTGGSVTVSSTTTDPQMSNNTVAPTPLDFSDSEFDLAISANQPIQFVPGQWTTLTLSVANNGPSDVPQATVTYNMAGSPLEVNTGSLPSGCTASGSTITCEITDPITAGGSKSVQIPVRVISSTPTGSVNVGSADVTSDTPDTNQANNHVDITGTVLAPVYDVAVTATTPNVVPGSTGTTTLTITNSGPSDAPGPIVVTYDLPSGLQAGTNMPAGCTATETQITCTFDGSLAASGTKTIDVPVKAPADKAPGTYPGGKASTPVGDGDTNADNNTFDTPGYVIDARQVDLGVTVPEFAVQPGVNATMNVVVTNNGPSQAQDGHVVITLPDGSDGLTFASFDSADVANCEISGDGLTATCDLVGQLDPNASKTLKFTVTPAEGITSGQYSGGSAVVSGTDTDTNMDNNTFEPIVYTVTEAIADLDIASTPLLMVPGTTGTLQVTVTNNGPAPSNAPVVLVTLPEGLTVDTDGTMPTGCVAKSATTVTCTATDSLAKSGTLNYGIPVKADSGLPVGALTGGELKVTSSTMDDNHENNTTTPTVTILDAQADLGITYTAPAAAIAPGASGTATLHVENFGPSDAADATVTWTLPAGVTASDLPEGCEGTTVITCELSAIAMGDTVDLPFTVTVAATATPDSTLTGSASVSSTTEEPEDATAENSVDTPIVVAGALADLSTTKEAVTPDSGSVAPGETFQYILTASNAGPSQAENVVITDDLPAGLTFVSDDGDVCSAVGQMVTCNLPDAIAAGSSGSVTITVRLASGYTGDGSDLTNVASSSSDAEDPNEYNNTSDPVDPPAIGDPINDLSIEKTAPTTAPVAGQNTTWSIAVHNAGPSDAPGYTVTDVLPAGLTFVSADGADCSANGQNVTCTVDTALVNDGDDSFTITAFVARNTVDETTFENTAMVAPVAPATDPDTTNNSSTATSEPSESSADLSITKTKPATAPAAGQDTTWTITVGNDGPSDAQNVVVTDTLDSALTFVSAEGAECSAEGQVVTCEIGTLAYDAEVVITLTTAVGANVADGTIIKNAASVTSDTTDENTTNNTTPDVESDPVVASADLSITKTKPATAPVAGEDTTWTITVHNDGPATATGVVVSDELAEGLSFVSADGADCTVEDQVVTCEVGSIENGADAVITLVTHVASNVAEGTVIKNAASVTADTSDDNPDNNTTPDVESDPVETSADLSTTKTASSTAPVAGENTTWTITVHNAGPSDAQNVVVTDTLDSALTFVSATGATCTAEDQVVTCTVGTIANGEDATITLTTLVAADTAAGTKIANSASTTSDTEDPDGNNNTSDPAESEEVETSADLSIVKTKPSTAPAAGADTTWTITVDNAGPSDAQNVVVTDTLDSALTFVSAEGAECSADGQVVTCVIGTLALNGQAVISLTTAVGEDVADGTVIKNAASVTSDTSDDNPENNTTPDVDSDPVAAVADLSITKTKPATAPVAGENTTWTITVHNDGPATATGVEVTDELAEGLTFVSAEGADCTAEGQLVTCTVGTIANGEDATITLVTLVAANVAEGTVIKNAASVTADTSDDNPDNNTTPDVDSDPVETSADLSTTKTASATAPVAGQNTTWTITVSNAGPSDAQNVVVTDELAEGLTFVSAEGAECAADGQKVTCTVGTLANGDEAVITLTTLVGADVAAGTKIANSASVTSDTTDPDGGNNTSDPAESEEVETSADLSTTKTASATAPVAGQNTTWTITVSNAGPSDAQNVVVTDELAEGLTFVSAEGAECAADGQKVTCTVGTLANGADAVITLTTLVGADVAEGTKIANSASTTSDTPDPDGDNNTSDPAESDPVETSADLSTTKTAASTAPVAGQNTTWTITVHNDGPSAAENVVVTDELAEGLTFVSADGADCTADGQTVTCAVGTLANGADAVITLTTLVGADVAEGTKIANSASTTSDTTDPNGGNNTSDPAESDPVETSADLSTTKTAAAEAPVAGQNTTWTITVSNAGPSDAQNVVVTDELAEGLTFVSATGATCTADGQVVTCEVGTLANGADATITLTTLVGADVAAGTKIANSASVTSDTKDPDGDNNTSDPAESEETETSADLSIVKTKPATAPAAGQNTTWTITVDNAGPSDAQNVVVTDTLDSALTFVSAEGAECSADGQVVTCEIGTLALNGQVVISLTTAVSADVAEGTIIKNAASVTSDTADDNPDNNTTPDVDSDPTEATADLSITKTKPATAPVAGEDTTWTITVHNDGPATATNVEVTDELAEGLTFVSADGADCTADGQTVTCVVGTLANGADAVITLTTHVASDVAEGTKIKNAASVTSDTADDNDGNNTTPDVESDEVETSADLSTTKNAAAEAPVAGQNTTWTITVSNAGPSDAQNVVVTDELAEGLTFVSATGADCTADGQVVTCTVGTLANGDDAVITLTTLVGADVAAGTKIANSASVTSDTTDPDGDNNTSDPAESDPVETSADLSTTKTAASTAPVAGQNTTWTITVSNAGPSDAQNVVVTDTLDSALTFVSATGADCTADGQVVTCTVGTLANGDDAVITLTTLVGADVAEGTKIANSASTTSDTTDPDGDNNTSDPAESDPVETSADLSTTKTASSTAPVAGQNTTWTITVHNDGPSAAENVVVTDELAEGLTFVSAEGADCTADGQKVTCEVGTLANGVDASITLTTLVGADVAEGTKIANSATATSDTTDPNEDNNGSEPAESEPVETSADLSTTKTAAAEAPVAGQNTTWTITVSNAGPSDAQNVVVTDELAEGLTFVSAEGADCEADGQTVTCTVGTLANGDDAVITLTTLVGADVAAGTKIANSASTTSDTTDPDGDNNTSDPAESDPVETSADLSTTKTAASTAPVAGQNTTWTITVSNAGPSDAQNVVVTDELAEGLTFVSATGADCTADGQKVTCEVGTIANGDDAVITLTTLVGADVAEGTKIANSASTTSDTTDPDGDNNTSDPAESDPVETSADLSTSKTAASTAPVAGQNTTWTITVHNDGPSAAENVVVTDELAEGLTFVSADGATCSADGQKVTCEVGTIANGDDAVITLTTLVGADVAEGTKIANSASTTSDTTDPNEDNNTSDPAESDPVETSADLSTTKTASDTAPVAGQNTTWTITVSNAGPSDAQNVVVTDELAEGLTFVSAEGADCTADGQTVTCEVGTLANGADATITLTTLVGADVAEGTKIANSASTTSDTTDPDGDNNTSDPAESDPVETSADLSTTKTAASTAPVAGENTTWTITVSNAGPSDAQNVVVTDELAEGLTFVSAEGADCEADGQTVTCTVATLANGADAVITLTTLVGADVAAGTKIANSASVKSDTTDPNEDNNGSDPAESDPVETSADLSTTKTPAETAPVAGENTTWTITVHNDGPSAAENVVVTDELVAGLTFVSAEGADCTADGQTVTCEVGTLANGDDAVITLTTLVAADVKAGTKIANSASVKSDTTDPNEDNNGSDPAESDPVETNADLSIVKTKPETAPVAGENTTWMITVKNNGPSDATNVVVTDDLDASLTFVSATGADCKAAGQKVTCTVETLANGDSAEIKLTTKVASSVAEGTVIKNAASVTADQTDDNDDNNTTPDISSDPVETSADLSTKKTASDTAPVAGQNTSWTITVHNAGPSDAVNVVATDTLDDALTFVAEGSSAGCEAVGQVVTCTQATLENGKDAVFTIVTAVSADVEPGTKIANSATATSDTKDPNGDNNGSDPIDTKPTVAEVDLVAGITAPESAKPGDTVTITGTVGNNGPSTAFDVEARMSAPNGLTFTECTVEVVDAVGPFSTFSLFSANSLAPMAGPNCTCTVENGVVVAKADWLAPGQQLVITALGTIAEDATGAVDVSLVATTLGEGTVETNLENNTATAQIAITEVAPVTPTTPTTPAPETTTIVEHVAGNPPAQHLVLTGAQTIALLGLAALLLVAGGWMLLGGRRRRDEDEEQTI